MVSDSGLVSNAYAVAGSREEAVAVLKELKKKYQKHELLGQYVALVYAGLGDSGQAFAWLEKDFQVHSGELSSVIEEPAAIRVTPTCWAELGSGPGRHRMKGCPVCKRVDNDDALTHRVELRSVEQGHVPGRGQIGYQHVCKSLP